MNRYSYFQFDGTIGSARAALESALGYPLTERDSFYWGIYFQARDLDSGFALKLHQNSDHEGEPIQSAFETEQVLCSVSGPIDIVDKAAAAVEAAGGRLITSEDIDDN